MQKIALVGATGDLGSRILIYLESLGAEVICIVRKGSSSPRLDSLKKQGTRFAEVEMSDYKSLVHALDGCTVVVSAVSGLRPALIEFQTLLLKAAVDAGIKRFFPSDFSIDYRPILPGENRNLNLREEFRIIIDAENRIEATSILNGAFMDMLSGAAPFILYPIKRILCWGNPNQLMDWTTIDDTARFAAYAIMDKSTPRFMKIAGDQITAVSLAETMSMITNKQYRVMKPGSLETFKKLINVTKFFGGQDNAVYPAWQGMQYMYNMYEGSCKFDQIDNTRYPVSFTNTRKFLEQFMNGEIEKYVPNG